MLIQRILQKSRIPKHKVNSHELYLCSSPCRHVASVRTLTVNNSMCWNQSLIKNSTNTIQYYNQRKYSSSLWMTRQSETDEIKLQKVLVANRGEIACRVQRTCHKWDIPTVAIYSCADSARAWHAQIATEAYEIGTGPAVSDSYLCMDDIIDIAIRSKCDSIHPGYGFLSENANFALKCNKAGLTFIGPSPSAITAMGDKAQSKAIMDIAGVPTTPGYYDASGRDDNLDVQNAEFLYPKAIDIGFPLLIKAVAGGGGKGMRIVWNANDFISSLNSCQNEAFNNFGNASVLLEKYLVKPRHVEIQIIGDTHGNVIHLNERDCSVQRRHQKVFEEAPALDIHDGLRKRFGDMAVVAAKAVQYVNAGTVEFLVDTNTKETGTIEQPFYFCEMNTRLQVEHPVTELITGIDLVEWQLRVAAGQTLPITNQSDISCTGHAIEARIYAERQTVDGTFLPATGTLWHHHYDTTSLVPTKTGTDKTVVRVDTGLRRTTDAADNVQQTYAQQAISVYYDPMISKLIVHGPDRTTALQQMVHSLQGYQIAGVPTNIPFLIKCAQHPAFVAGGEHVTTGFLDDYGSDVNIISTEQDELCHVAGIFALLLHLENRLEPTKVSFKTPWSNEWGSWRIGSNNNVVQQTVTLKDGTEIKIWKYKDGSYDIQPSTSCSTKYHVAGWIDTTTNTIEIVINQSQRIQMTTVVQLASDSIADDTINIRMWPNTVGMSAVSSWELDVMNPMVSLASIHDITNETLSSKGNGIVKSPMPGKVSRINHKVGDTVEQGDTVAVMEAMKMEHPLLAPCSGTVLTLHYNVGDVIMKDGAVVFVIQSTIDEDVAV